MANDILGYNRCQDCGGRSGVMQAKRKGAHLYERCLDADCGLNQKTGKINQMRLFYETEWISEPPPRPENVTDQVTEKVTEPETEKASNSEGSGDFDPGAESTESKPNRKPKGRFLTGFGVTLVLTALGVAAWKA